MKYFLLLLFSITSTFLLGQNTESFTTEFSFPGCKEEGNCIRPVDHTVDPSGNIYILAYGGNDYGVIISKYHPQYGLLWTKEFSHGSKDLDPKQIYWSKLGELLVVADATELDNNDYYRLYFARISKDGNVLHEALYNMTDEEGSLQVRKIDELATGDIIFRVEGNIDLTKRNYSGLIRMDYQGQVQNAIFIDNVFIRDFHINRNNEIYVVGRKHEEGDTPILQFDHRLQLLASRMLYTTDGAAIHPNIISENAAAQPVIWFINPRGTNYSTFNMYSDGPFPSYSYGQQDESIYLSDNRSNTGSVIVAAKTNSSTRFYQHDHHEKISPVFLEARRNVGNSYFPFKSYEITADNRIMALTNGTKNTSNNDNVFTFMSSKIDFQPACDFYSQTYGPPLEYSIRSRQLDREINSFPIRKIDVQTNVTTLELSWNMVCQEVCEEEPSTPSISLSPLSNWRYQFEASGELDPSITDFSWSVNDLTVGSGPVLDHTFEEAGQYRVCLRIITACGTEVLVCQNVYIPAARKWNPGQSPRVQAWPNPVMDQLHVNTENLKIETINIYNHLGQKFQLPWQLESDVQISIQTSALVRGQYFLELIEHNGQVQSLKFIK